MTSTAVKSAPPGVPAAATESFWQRQAACSATPGRVVAVVNPASGDADVKDVGTTDLVTKLQADLATQGVRLESLVFDPQGFAEVLRGCLGDDLLAIVVFGGDGTVLAVVEALQGAPVPIGIVPRGTMNWLARDLGLPPEPDRALEALRHPLPQRIDLARVNGEPFLCACMVGVAALLARYREHNRHQTRWRRWPGLLLMALKLWGRYPHLRMTLVTDNQHHRLRSRTLVVTNNRIAPALRLLPYRPRLNAGLLELHAMRRATPKRLWALLGHLMAGDWCVDDVVLTRTAAAMRIDLAGQQSLPVLLDGEMKRLRPPLHFESEPGAVLMLAPSTPAGESG